MLSTKKRSGRIKERGCADGCKQREYMKNEKNYSTTVSTEDLMLSYLMDTKEGRDVATIDTPGAFMHAYMKDEVNMKIEGTMANIFANIYPQLYEEYVTMENGKKILYVRLNKSLYGTVQAALLFYQKLTGKLKEWGFELNTYYTCVANKTIYGKHCTILWHVDDLNIFHVEYKVVDSIIKLFDEEFGIYAPLEVI